MPIFESIKFALSSAKARVKAISMGCSEGVVLDTSPALRIIGEE
jgi:hypothetical protein